MYNEIQKPFPCENRSVNPSNVYVESHGKIRGIPWNSVEFYGIPMEFHEKFHGIPRNFMKLRLVEFHGIS
jgi:hypothetical protein